MVGDGHQLGEPNQFMEGIQSNRSNSPFRSISAVLVGVSASWFGTKN